MAEVGVALDATKLYPDGEKPCMVEKSWRGSFARLWCLELIDRHQPRLDTPSMENRVASRRLWQVPTLMGVGLASLGSPLQDILYLYCRG